MAIYGIQQHQFIDYILNEYLDIIKGFRIVSELVYKVPKSDLIGLISCLTSMVNSWCHVVTVSYTINTFRGRLNLSG